MTQKQDEPPKDRKDRKGLWLAVRIAVAAALLGGMAWAADFSTATVVLDGSTLLGVLAACLVLVVTLHLSAIRWHVVLGSDDPGVMALSKLYFIGWFFSQFLPSSVGGDAARLIGLRQSGTPLARAGSSIVLERLLGLAALLVFLAAGVMVFPALARLTAEGSSLGLPTRWLVVGAGVGTVAALVGAVLLLRNERFRRLVQDTFSLWQGFLGSKDRLVWAVVLSFLVQAGYILVWVAIAWGLRLAIPLAVHLFFLPAVSLAALLPVTVSGLGVREGFTVLILAPLGVAVPDAVAYGLLFYGCSVVVGGIGGLVFLRSGLEVRELPDPAEDALRGRSGHMAAPPLGFEGCETSPQGRGGESRAGAGRTSQGDEV
ncbi:lysylphosphatidylglycerol synthase transmembrane domain-containing protein [soil metagenome]